MQRLPGLDVLRAIAIVWVMLYHASIMQLGTPWAPLSGYGWMGVDLFFVLSGYLIGSQWLKQLQTAMDQQQSGTTHAVGRAWWQFYLRRAWRILPAYWLVLALYLAFPALREKPDMMPWWQFLSFTENWFVDASMGRAFSHAWSLCVEEHFYLLLPVCSYLLMRRPWAGRTLAVLALLVLAGVIWRAQLWYGHIADLPESGPGNLYQRFMEQIYYPSWTRLDGLLAGVGLAMMRLYRPLWWDKLLQYRAALTVAGLALLALAMYAFRAGQVSGNATFGYPLIALAFASLVAVAAGSPLTGEGSGSRPRWLLTGTLAQLAYSLYLTHKLSFHALRLLAGPYLQQHPWLAFAAYSLAALLPACLLYRLVESPLLALRDRMGVVNTSSNPAGNPAANPAAT